MGRRATVGVTVIAVASLAMGSWLMTSPSGASVGAPPRQERVGSTTAWGAAAPASRGSATVPASTGPAAGPPPTVTPSIVAPSAVTPHAGPPSTVAPSAPAAPVAAPSRSTPLPSPAARAATARLPHAAVAAAPTPSGSAAVATALIVAVDRQSRRHIPATADNVKLLQRWMANEGGMWADNPLNTSLHASAYPHQFTSSGQDSGIPIFPSMGVGVTATATTLVSNPSYARILGTLGSGTASCLAFARAVIRSPWASSHYGRDPSGFCSGHIAPARRGRAPHPRRR